MTCRDCYQLSTIQLLVYPANIVILGCAWFRSRVVSLSEFRLLARAIPPSFVVIFRRWLIWLNVRPLAFIRRDTRACWRPQMAMQRDYVRDFFNSDVNHRHVVRHQSPQSATFRNEEYHYDENLNGWLAFHHHCHFWCVNVFTAFSIDNSHNYFSSSGISRYSDPFAAWLINYLLFGLQQNGRFWTCIHCCWLG